MRTWRLRHCLSTAGRGRSPSKPIPGTSVVRPPSQASPVAPLTRHTYLRRKVEDMQDIDHGEMLAIAEALDAAICLARSGEFKGAARIFSD